MSFLSVVTSVFTARPIRLYEFQRGVMRWRYTSADRAISFQTHEYAPIAISDSGPKRTGDPGADMVKVRVPWTNPIARMFRGTPPSDEIDLIIRDLHQGDDGHRVAWSGTVDGAKFPSPERAELLCYTLAASMQRPGLRLGWERACPYAVFDADCTLSPDSFAVTALVQSMDGASITSATFASYPVDYFAGGILEWSIGSGEVERRSIETHVGGVLRLLGGTQGVSASMQVIAYPGCTGTTSMCSDRYSNLPNHGGIPHLPGKSPFEGDPIFW